MACWRFDHPVVDVGLGDLLLDLADAGQHAHHAFHAAQLLHLLQLVGEVVEVELPLLELRGHLLGLVDVEVGGGLLDQRHHVALAEDAAGDAAASNTSSASIFSPVPRNLIGRPVTARIDSAAPPRASPSARVSTRPVSGSRSWKALAVRTASWPVRLSATSRVSAGCAMRAISAASLIIASSSVVRPAVSRMSDVVAAEPGGRERAAGDVVRRLAGDDRQASRPRPARPGRQLLHARPGGGCRARPSAPSACSRSCSRSPAWRSWWSCRSPAGRPSGSPIGGVGGEVDAARGIRAEHLDQAVVDDLDDHLAGRIERITSSPTAFSFALAMKSRTTGSATSASSSATRTSRIASSTSVSVSAPLPGELVEDGVEPVR